nr:NF-X1-type zinc finger protein NFXL1-like [Ipomoea trifida]
MNFPVQSNRSDNSRRGRNYPGQTARQEWVPRGSSSTTAPTATVTTTVESPAVAVDNLSSVGIGRELEDRSVPQVYRSRNYTGPRRNAVRYANQRRDRGMGRDKDNSERNKAEKVKEPDHNNESKQLNDPNLPQLVQEIQEKLLKGTVECMICYDMVRRSASIWSCSSCYSIFHLNCIKKWARAPTSVDLSAEKNQGFNWRCPGCQYVQLTSSKDIRYICFCGKRQDPPTDLYLTPHSCGEPCGKPLEKEVPGSGMSKEDLCPHHCVLQCHPGPCPPCKAFAPPRSCPCGKKVITTRCSDRKSVLTCGQRCDKLLACGRHQCERICHVGPCDHCQVLVNASCFCKKKTEVVLCGDMAVKGEIKVENGVFSCSSHCEKKLSCGNHVCHEICHPGPCGDCALSPIKVKTCWCGKTSLTEARNSCLDPIPTCSEVCTKTLRCGVHRCEKVCHSGDCAPCHVPVTQRCRCGSTSRTVECYRTFAEDDIFTCDRPCGRKKSCGRHRCSERCCPLSNPNSSLTGDWDPHFCSMPCGKKLRCGQHSCESLCHSGHCPPCLETIFNDLTCACGRTSIPPPLPCGTPSPSCQYPCSIPQPCGHSSTHSCHFGDCPPCAVPIAKECIGGHVVLRNIPCGSKDIRCNKLCGKTRQCGLHACARTCHPAPCDSSAGANAGSRASCGQTCGAPRRDCRHTCTALCHPSTPCPDTRCEFPVTISCSCGRITASVPCDAGGSNGGHSADSIFEASILQKLTSPLQPVEGNGKKVPLGQRKLICDDECAKMEKKKVLADAFGINSSNSDALHFGENTAVSEVLSDLLRRDSKWVFSVEERCKFLVLGRGRGGVNALKVHVFCPMLKEKRDAVRLIAERWKLTVSAAGWEPKRFVVVHATPKSKAPARILGAKGCTASSMLQPAIFDPLVDMDPRLVVALFDLPRDADISALVLRFGGECELVWLNDKNALAVFSDPARASAAMRRLDQGSAYYGAVGVPQIGVAPATSNAWGGSSVNKDAGGGPMLKDNAWKQAVVQELNQRETTWGGSEEWTNSSSNMEPGVWKGKEAPPLAAASSNRWSVLDTETAPSSSATSSTVKGSLKKSAPNQVSDNETEAQSSDLQGQPQHEGNAAAADVVDNWEEACD